MTSEERRTIKSMREAFNMTKQRCYNPNTRDYRRYGARGITICSRWLESFDNFIEDMGLRPEGCTLERKDNDGPYSPENCIWATRAVQSKNKENTVKITHKGETKSVREWAEITGIPYKTLMARVFTLGYSVEEALTKEVKCGGLLAGREYKKRRKPDTSNIPRGFDSPNSSLTRDSVTEIQRLHKEEKWTYTALAKKYGVCIETASRAAQGDGHFNLEAKNDKNFDT